MLDTVFSLLIAMHFLWILLKQKISSFGVAMAQEGELFVCLSVFNHLMSLQTSKTNQGLSTGFFKQMVS